MSDPKFYNPHFLAEFVDLFNGDSTVIISDELRREWDKTRKQREMADRLLRKE